MKPVSKIIAVLFCLQFSLTAKAQINKKDFAGIWEFVQFGADSANLGPSARGVLTVRTDSTFVVVRQTQNGAVITQSGTVKVPDAQFFVQKKVYQLPAIGTEGVGQEDKIYYKFAADKRSVRFSYALASGEVYYEVWRKL